MASRPWHEGDASLSTNAPATPATGRASTRPPTKGITATDRSAGTNYDPVAVSDGWMVTRMALGAPSNTPI